MSVYVNIYGLPAVADSKHLHLSLAAGRCLITNLPGACQYGDIECKQTMITA